VPKSKGQISFIGYYQLIGGLFLPSRCAGKIMMYLNIQQIIQSLLDQAVSISSVDCTVLSIF
jgi:hypothetical protein